MRKLPNKFLKFIYLVLGSLSLVLGVLGIILPILPTVPFFLLTAYFYAKGSQRFHQWFIHTKLYQSRISSLAEHQTMSLAGGLFLLILVSVMLLSVTLVFADNLIVAIILPVLDLVKYIYFIFKIKFTTRSELILLRQKFTVEAVSNPLEEEKSS